MSLDATMRGVGTVLFDFDGTLMDASEAICGAFRAALQEPSMRDSRIRAMIGRPLREMFLEVRPSATSHEVDELVVRYREAFTPLSATKTRPLPGAVELVQHMPAGVKLGIVTTRLAEGAVQMLRIHQMLDSFSCVIGLEHVDRVKPDPQPIERALAELQREPQTTLMIGDTPDDIVAGRRAGCRTIGVTTGAFDRDALVGAGADLVTHSLKALLPGLDCMQASTSP